LGGGRVQYGVSKLVSDLISKKHIKKLIIV
jgi:hypothetical protein